MSTRSLERSSFLAGANSAFIEALYARYVKDPASVDTGWREFFSDLKDEAPSVLRALEGASWSPRGGRPADGNGLAEAPAAAPPKANGHGAISEDELRAATIDSIRALMLIRAYRVRGHLHARLDPLGLHVADENSELDMESYGFSEADLDRPIFIDHVLGLDRPTLREILQRLRETYCGTIGVEYMHIQEPDQKQWIQERIEAIHNRTEFTERGQEAILERLTEAETFENFLNTKYPGAKRFGLDGGESLIPALEQILKRGS